MSAADDAAPDLAARPVRAFLAALASGAPAPGGGAAAALAGALGAGLVAMVCRVTAEREAALGAEMSAAAGRADVLRARLEDLMTEDAEAYRRVIAARRAGEGADAVQRALIGATEVPIALARAAAEALALGADSAGRIRASALGDVAVAGALAWGAVESAAITARANLGALTDAVRARGLESELAALVDAAAAARGRMRAALEGRGLASGGG